MIAFLIVLLAAAVYLMFSAAARSPDRMTPADFDFLAVSEQIDQISETKAALQECEALETAAEMSAPDLHIALRLSWTDDEDHDLTVYLAGDFTAECVRMLAARECQELRSDLASEIMEANRNANGVEFLAKKHNRGGEGRV